MFTGIVEEVGRVVGFEQHEAGARVIIRAASVLNDLTIGSSIAVNGACVTAVEVNGDRWTADLAPETLARTNFSDLRPGCAVNLERPLRANGRLDGHFVLGHVDGVAVVNEIRALGDDNWWLSIRIPPELARYVVSKGSLAVDGISLTVAQIDEDLVSFTVIPHTYRNTRLNTLQVGWRVNIEVDILAKHLEKLKAG